MQIRSQFLLLALGLVSTVIWVCASGLNVTPEAQKTKVERVLAELRALEAKGQPITLTEAEWQRAIYENLATAAVKLRQQEQAQAPSPSSNGEAGTAKNSSAGNAIESVRADFLQLNERITQAKRYAANYVNLQRELRAQKYILQAIIARTPGVTVSSFESTLVDFEPTSPPRPAWLLRVDATPPAESASLIPPSSVVVTGAIKAPGVYALPGATATLKEVLALAGGYAWSRWHPDPFLIMRPGPDCTLKAFSIDVNGRIGENGLPEKSGTEIRVGDFIFVRENSR